MEEISGAWDIEVEERRKSGSEEIGFIRDEIIVDWLLLGDTRPFCDWVLNRKHVPSKRVVETIAFMMLRSVGKKLAPKYDEEYPYSLEIGNRAPNRKKNPETPITDWLIGGNVTRLINEGMKYEAAIATVRDLFEEDGVPISKGKIEKAYSKYKKRLVTLNK
ncbi:MAG: hypothetical protein JKY32_06560 [Rhizobiales bacterium]|nr:hypothetical protein [Hyphomicrobiales bacterium]